MSKFGKLKPCVVFDLDDTLVEMPTDWKSEDIMKAKPNQTVAFLFHALDFMINDPPENLRGNPEWPVDIFFLTARPEAMREDTIFNLARITKDSGAAINKRLIMRPDYMDGWPIGSQFDTKTFLIKKLRERGYYPAIAFDNDGQAIDAYTKAGAVTALRTLTCERDKEEHYNRD